MSKPLVDRVRRRTARRAGHWSGRAGPRRFGGAFRLVRLQHQVSSRARGSSRPGRRWSPSGRPVVLPASLDQRMDSSGMVQLPLGSAYGPRPFCINFSRRRGGVSENSETHDAGREPSFPDQCAARLQGVNLFSGCVVARSDGGGRLHHHHVLGSVAHDALGPEARTDLTIPLAGPTAGEPVPN